MPKNHSVHQEIWFIALPMLLTGISTPLLGLVDTAVVGHLPEPHFLAAIAIGAMIFNLLFWAMGFLRMGTTGLTARALGERKESELVSILIRGLSISTILGAAVIIIQTPIKEAIFYFVDSTPDVLFHAKVYFDIRIWSAPATLASYVLLGWFLGLQKPKINLMIVISLNLINILLDVFFVVYLNFDSSGVAWATLIAEYSGLFIGIAIAWRIVKTKSADNWRQIYDCKEIRKYLSLNLDVFLRTLFLLLSFSFFTLQSAKYGPIVLAANSILMNLQTLMSYALDSLAHAAEVLVGKYIGCKQELFSVIKITGYWSVGFACLIALIYWALGSSIIGMLTDIDDVAATVVIYLPWLILSPVLSVWSYWFDGIFIGAGYSREMRDTMLISFIVFLLSFLILAGWGNHGLWAALMIFMVARAVSMGFIANRKLKGLAV